MNSVLYYFHVWNPWKLKLSIAASCEVTHKSPKALQDASSTPRNIQNYAQNSKLRKKAKLRQKHKITPKTQNYDKNAKLRQVTPNYANKSKLRQKH